MNDIRVDIRFKNNILLKKIECDYKSIPLFCEENNLAYTTLSGYITLRYNPVTNNNRFLSLIPVHSGLYWKKSAQRISDALLCLPGDIFPESTWRDNKKNRYYLEVDSADISNVIAGFYGTKFITPTESQEKKELEGAVVDILSTLTPREEQVINRRFGMSGAEETYAEIALDFDVSLERVRQVEYVALRKLREPVRSKRLKANLGGMDNEHPTH